MKDYEVPMAATEETGVGTDLTLAELTAKDLQQRSEVEIDEIYRESDTPEVQELEGRYHGTVVSGSVFPFDVDGALHLINNPWMPWKGKKFYPIDDEEARGCNWYEVGPMERNGYRFVGRQTPAIYGLNDAYVADYDLPDNPGAVQSVRDEIKRVREGLYLGRTYMRIRGEHQFVMYFALDG